MAVYVDDLMNWGWRYGRSCHLTADTLAELHDFADRLGLKRIWYQPSASMPHYDLTEGKRARAVSLGAVEIDRREMVRQMKAWIERAMEFIKSCPDEHQDLARHHVFFGVGV